ncbi:hypothetical protein I6U48_23450 [Clostridium sp. PL3]|uniref:Uncharacterized protein n=1 Tax=Clostridium thailandense TaxID=2794346 RepID=A0A949WT32_9CLOT|nr:hypothetical protein [Clostridium thailandense]MBV7275855.1 hypothetical protein [Clostridium thailandense]
MGCGGGFSDLFRIVDNYGYSRRGCGSDRQPYHDYYEQDDTEEKLIIVKKMYAEDLINDEEFQSYKERIYNRNISFDELVSIKRSRSNGTYRKTTPVETGSNSSEPSGKYKDRLKKLNESKVKITEVQGKLISSIKDLEKEKTRMETLAETMLKSSDEAAEKYINKKIDLEETIQNLVRRNKELEVQAGEINRAIKELESKELELEAVRLQEELSKITFEDK